MRWIVKLALRLRSLFRRPLVEDELDYEFRFHLDQQIEENLAAGMEPQAAHRAALRALGAVEHFKEECRDKRRVGYVEDFFQDVRYGLRQLRQAPGFTAVGLITLALGIGANTTIFSITDQVLLRSLPVPHPEELVVLRSPGYKTGSVWTDGDAAQSFSYPMYKELRDRGRDIAALFARFDVSLNVSARGQTEHVDGELVSGNYFEALGVAPALGRMLTPDDESAPGTNPVAVLSYAYWSRRFGADPATLNQTLAVNGTSLTVVGVARPGFTGVQIGELPDVFIPITMKEQMTPNSHGFNQPANYWLAILGRLRPGFTPARAQAALLPAYRAVLESQARETKVSAANLQRFIDKPILLAPGAGGRQILQRNAKDPLIILMAMVGLVLLITCANLAGLLLARGAARQREMALRLALGASRRRLVRQLLTESFLLAFIGGGVGLVLGLWTLKALVASIPESYGALGLHARPDRTVLGFAIAISVLTGLLFGLAPALRATRASLQSAMKDQGSSVSEGMANMRLRKVLIVSQIAVTTMLLIGAGLFARSLDRLKGVDLGVRTDNLIAFSVSPELNRYTPPQTAAFADRLRETIAALPGVRSVSAAEIAVLSDNRSNSNITVEGYTPRENEDILQVGVNHIGPAFFSTMGIPLLAGRELSAVDASDSPKVALVNESYARRFFDGRSPVGTHFAFGAGDEVHPDIEVVGLVKDSKHSRVKEEIQSFVYLPYAQDKTLGLLTFYVRTSQNPAAIFPALRQAVAKLDGDLPVTHLTAMTAQVDELLFNDRLLTELSLAFALLAAFLAAIGLYGIMAYTVARRGREVGIRMALGAPRRGVVWLVLREVVQMAAAGLLAGSIAAFMLGQFIEAQLFGVKAKDPAAFAISAGLLTLVSLLAGYVPARRAASVDPMEALRYQ